MEGCKIEKVYKPDLRLNPKIINFQNGELVISNKLECGSYINTKNNNTTVAVATDRLTYVGEVNKDEAFYNVLAIRNKSTNKVRLVPINTVTMNVCMIKKNESLETTLNSSTSNVRELYKQFGSKRDKRRTEQYERMKMNVSNVEEELKSTVANVSVKEDDLVAHTKDDKETEYRPNINRNASLVQDIYDLYTIIQKEDLDLLEDIAIDIIKNSVIQEQLSPFTLECINQLKQASVTNKEKYEILLYCDAILKFFKLTTQSIRSKSFKISIYPQKIVGKILNDYTVFSGNTRLRPYSMRDKAVCYVMVLGLLAMNYKLDLEPLSRSINVSLKKLCEISRILGAQPLSSSCRTTVVLKLPLPPPVTKFRSPKKK